MSGDASERVREDGEIVEALRRREEDGLRRLLSVHGGRVRGWLRMRFAGRLADQDIAEILHESAYRAWRNVDRFEESKGTLGGWLLRIAGNVAIDLLRREGRQRHELLGPAVEAARPAEPVPEGNGNLREVVRRLIDGLPRLQREILEADLAAGGTAEAEPLASELGTTVNSVYVSRSKARRKLAEEIRALGLIPEEDRTS
ncbi:MAG: sigma-70 family RNA polymerase sigma factor [Planctomycetota bacterium]